MQRRERKKLRHAAKQKEDDFWEIGLSIMNCENSRASKKTLTKRFLSFLGAEPLYISMIWLLLEQSGWLRFGAQIKECHLLWTFMFLKVYSTETVQARTVGCDEKTFRERVWFLAEGIANLDTKLVSDKLDLYFYL